MLRKLVFFILIILAFKGCTKDDICPEGTAITPKMIVTFYDKANPLLKKKVNLLSVLTDNLDSTAVVKYQNTDSIAIPLNTGSDTTKYLFKRSVISGSDTLVNIDRVSFIYQRNDIYVNRACGFRTEYTNLSGQLENEGPNNWITQITVNKQSVIHEDSAHITMLH